MRSAFYILMIIMFAIPCFAVFWLIKSIREGKVDNGARDRFLESIMAETMKNKESKEESSTEVYEEPEELDESIILAKKIAAETFAVKNEVQVSEKVPDIVPNDTKAVQKSEDEPSESVPDKSAPEDNSSGENKLTREQALQMVENMLGRSKKKDAGSELREMMIRFAAEKNKKNN